MHYLLLLYAKEGGWDKLSPEQQEAGVAAYNAYTEALKEAGALVGSNRLQPSDAATRVQVEEEVDVGPVFVPENPVGEALDKKHPHGEDVTTGVR